jgi:hypothetical protein
MLGCWRSFCSLLQSHDTGTSRKHNRSFINFVNFHSFCLDHERNQRHSSRSHAIAKPFPTNQPSFLVASGANTFLEELVQLLDLPGVTDINRFKVQKSKTSNANTSNMAFFTFNRKNQHEGYGKRIYLLDFLGLPAESSRTDRQIFIDSALPMNQELMIISLGNLVKFLHNNFKLRHIFLNLEASPIFTNLIVFSMESQVLLDDTTFAALNIFSNIYHSSSFKTQVRRDGLSLFNMLNQCNSSVGV